ncbi:hypothetical protein Pfo_014016 [Paulownia fortunei]|nr:hypothetical protein Pfo_014016 [Paulownia fortunei]
MKDCQKRCQPNSTDSVIAALMGLDELSPQQPFRQKKRVLSESYVRKVASIGLRPGSLVSIGHSCSTNNDIVKGVSGVQISKSKNDNFLDNCVNLSTSKVKKDTRSPKPAGASVSKSLSGATYEDRRSFRKKGEHRASGHVLRYRQKLEHDSLAGHLGELGVDYMNKSSKFQLEMIDKPQLFSTSISAFKPKSEKVKLDLHFRPGYREHRESLRTESNKYHHELTNKEQVVNSIVSPRHRCIACTRTMNRISQQERRRSKFEEVSRPGYMGDNYIENEVEALVLSGPGINDYKNYSHDPHLLLDESSLPNGFKKQNFERWKIAKEVQEVGVSGRRQTLDEMLALADKKSMPRNLNMRLGRNALCSLSSLQSRSSGSSSPSVFSSMDVREDDYLKSIPAFEFEATKETLSSGWNLTQDESTARGNKSKEQTISQKDILESKGGRGYEQFQTSPGVNDTMSPSSKVSDIYSCYFSCFDSVYNNPDTYIQGVHDEKDNCSENYTCREIELSQRNSQSSISNLTAQYVNDATYASAEAFNIGVCSRINGDPQSESNPGTLSGEGGHSSYVQEVLSGEASLNEFSEGESAYSNCSRIGPPEFQDNLRRTNQNSPDSVLEPFDLQNSSTFECFDRLGLQLQLQALNFESEETYSEGSVMVVSGDDDLEEQFGDISHDGRKVKRWLGDDKSRNFSYLVDVLDEAGLCGMKSFLDFKTWYSLECPLSPLVFEALEKKYGKQTFWHKSERQLLFDRINSGLMGIFNPVINFHACATSIRRRVCASLRRDEVEDELWMMLISQEKEKSKGLSEKALEKWLEFEEGINIICKELETSLFDELVMELASLWN